MHQARDATRRATERRAILHARRVINQTFFASHFGFVMTKIEKKKLKWAGGWSSRAPAVSETLVFNFSIDTYHPFRA
jgi:hypothetical protein